MAAATAQAGLREALDREELNWSTGGGIAWSEVAAVDAGRGTAAQWQVPLIGYNPWPEREGWLETTVTGPAVFSCRARRNQNPYLSFAIMVNGTPVGLQRNLTGSFFAQTTWDPWVTVSCFVPEGSQRIRIKACLGCDGAGTLPMNQPSYQVDAVEIRGSDSGVAAALETPDVDWFTAGAPLPAVVTGPAAHDGEDAVTLTDQRSETWLRGRLTGPATLEWWEVGRGTFSLNGQVMSSESSAWTKRRVFVPPGAALVQWDFGSVETTRTLTLDEVGVVPASAVDAAAALTTPETPAGVVLSGGWSGAMTSSAPDGQHLSWTTAVQGSPETLRIPVSGAGILHMVMAFRNRPDTTWTVDGRPAAHDSQSADGEFAAYRFFIPPGAQWFEMRVQTGAFTPATPATVLVDAVRFVPAGAVPLTSALDEQAVTFTTHPERPWHGLVWDNSRDGVDSCPSADSQAGETYLDAQFDGPGTLRFEWTSTFRSTYGFPVVVLLNGRPMALRVEDYAHDGGQVRGRAEIEAGPGRHRVRWVVPAGRPFSFFTLDRVAWVPHSAHRGGALLTALDGWMASGVPWVADEEVSPQANGPSLRFGPIAGLADATSNYDHTGPLLHLPVSGPATARFMVRTENGRVVVSARGQRARTITTAAAQWTPVEVLIPPGSSALELLPSGAGVFSPSATTIWITDFTLTGIERPLGASLNAPALTWSTSAANPWAGTPGEALAGLTVTASPSWLETTVTGPCLVDWQVAGSIDLTLNGSAVPRGYAEDVSVYRPAGIFVPPGAQVLRWTDAGVLLGRLRNVTVSPMSGLPSVTRTGQSLRFRFPRPAGVLDAQLKPQVAYGAPSMFNTMFQGYSIVESTPDHVLFEIPVSPVQPTMFLRMSFQR